MPLDKTSGDWRDLRRVAVAAAERSRSKGSAEDAAQEALMRLLEVERAGGTVTDEASFVASQARFRIANEVRSGERRRVREEDYARSTETSTAGEPIAQPMALLRHRIPEALLPLALLLLQGHTVREIATKTRRSIGAVQRRIEWLRDLLAEKAP
jgi:DNA-directed RNA polymerase specialized sigma24 family protein